MHAMRSAIRSLLRRPRYAASIVGTLSLGLFVSLSMFALVWHVLYRSLPVPDSEQLYILKTLRTETKAAGALTGLEAEQLPRYLPANIKMASYFWNGATYTGGEKPLVVTTMSTDVALFETLQIRPVLGRGLQASDAGSSNILLTDASWRKLFNADPNIIGKPFRQQGGDQIIVGVLPPSFELIMPAVTYFAPIDFQTMRKNTGVHNNARFFEALIRIPTSAAQSFPEQVQHAAQTINTQAGYPAGAFEFQTSRFRDSIVGDIRAPLQALLGLGVLVLLITLANAAHLAASRAAQREQQFAVCNALGASTTQQLLAQSFESLIIATAAATLALIGFVALATTINFNAINLPLLQDFGLSRDLLIATVLVLILCALALFAIPLQMRLRANQQTLRGRGLQSIGILHRFLSIPAIACSLVAIGTGALYLQSSRQLQNQPLGLDVTRVLASQTWLSGAPADWRSKAQRWLDAAKTLPDIQAVGLTNRLPFNPTSNFSHDLNNDRTGKVTKTLVNVVAGDANKVLGYQLLQGREINDQDQQAGHVALVNEQFVRSYFSGKDAIGQFINIPPYGEGEMTPFQIVGIVGDARTVNPALAPVAEITLPFGQYPVNGMAVVVKTSTDSKAQIQTLDQLLPNTLAEHYAFRSYAIADDLFELAAPQRFFTRFANLFAVIAFVMAGIGIYALLAFDLSLRRAEFALRAAIGATAKHQLKAAAKPTLLALCVGGSIGLIAFIALAKQLQPQIFGQLNAANAAGIAIIAVIIGALLAIWFAARSTLKLDLSNTIRS
jgi:predicted permease